MFLQRFHLSLLLIVFAPLSLYAQEPSGEPVAEERVYDPLEGFNRAMFAFNDTVDVYLFEPVASGYDSITPEFLQQRVRNVFETLGYPKYLVSDLVQLKFGQAAEHTGRFLVNATLGLAGIFDVATEMGLPAHREDFGTALHYHGVPAGPYLVLPFVGPTNFRDGFGRIVDSFLDPAYWIAYETAEDDDNFYISVGVTVFDGLQTRADLLDAAKEASLDYYLFTQGAYYQYRQGLMSDGEVQGMGAALGASSSNDAGEDYGSFEDPFE